MTDPLAANDLPLTIQRSNGAVNLQFPWNLSASDLDWGVERSAGLVSNAWNAAPHVVETTHAGRVRIELGEADASGFFRLNPSVAAPELIMDVLDDGFGWLLFNNAQFVSLSDSLFPMVGNSFFKHSVGADWSHSALFKPTNLILAEGRYRVSLSVGHDGTSRPFATNAVTLGLFDSASTLSRAVDVRNAVDAFDGLAGVVRTDVSTPVPFNGWRQWIIEYDIASGSAAIGRPVGFGIHAQSKGDGGTQAMFDNLSIRLGDAEPIIVYADSIVRAALPSTLFNGHVVHHRASISNTIWFARDAGNTLRQGYTAEAFDSLLLHGVRYPGGTAAKEWYDYDDQGGTAWLAEQGVSNLSTGTLDTVSDVLSWCRDETLNPYFLVPVVRFWEGSQYGVASNYAVHAVSMTQSNAAALGAPMPEYWDIGNEIYEPEYDSTQYARFAGRIAQGIKGVDAALKPVVCVKRGNLSAGQEIADTLQSNPDWWNAVEGVTFHALNFSESVWGGNGLYDQAMDMQALFPGKEFLVTALAPSSSNGLVCANAVLGSYEQLIRAGTGHIVNWPITHFNVSGRHWIDGQGVTPSGKVLRWLSKSGVGGDMLQVWEQSGEMKVLALREAGGNLTVYIAGLSSEIGREISLSIDGFQGSEVYAVRLKAAGGDTGSDELEQEPLVVAGTNPYRFTLNQDSHYEIVKIEVRP